MRADEIEYKYCNRLSSRISNYPDFSEADRIVRDAVREAYAKGYKDAVRDSKH